MLEKLAITINLFPGSLNQISQYFQTALTRLNFLHKLPDLCNIIISMIEISDFRSGFFLGPKKNKDETEEKQEIVCLINFESLVTKGKKRDSFIEILYLFSFPQNG